MGIFKKLTTEHGGFEDISELVGEDKLDKYCDRIYQQYCRLYSAPDYLLNVEWLLRHFNASKKMTLSALFYTQTEYLFNHNIKNQVFYSMYYCLFSAFSSNILLFPQTSLNKVQKISHSNIFKLVENYLVKTGVYNSQVIDLLNELRLMREAYSYHLPLGGSFLRDGEKVNIESLFIKLKDILPIVLQITNLFSYLSYYAWNKKVGKAIDEYTKHQSEVDAMFFSFIEIHDHLGKYCLIDDDDYLRQGYVLRKWNTPFPISWFITEKMCEDLECGWEDGEGYDINEVARYLVSTTNAY
ncbi:hypothetical protein HC024_14115 [Methylococcaceae bacterium WWC4]|nr:hypothetical protein [Methylococcaceae bacterium WWC4]